MEGLTSRWCHVVTAQSFSAFFASAYEPVVKAYVTKRGSLYFSKAPPDFIGRYGRREGRRERVRGEYRFEFERGGEGEGKGEYRFMKLME